MFNVDTVLHEIGGAAGLTNKATDLDTDPLNIVYGYPVASRPFGR